ncbi:sugar phosphate isomerase/epimerase [Candidatus Bipolaricaulota bacterium]|nr:sugar phosphate isomerase/epimerase [Candidatus Bipolaricaulota bacterium]
MKLGVITNGIDNNLEHALRVMNEFELTQAELQFVGDKEVGDLSAAEIDEVGELVTKHNVEVSCISRGIFGGMLLGPLTIDSPEYKAQIDALRRCISMAKTLDCSLVRVMSFRKEMIIFGSHGADIWNVSVGAWDKLLELMALPVQIAEEEGVTLVAETGNNAMITSAYLGRRLIDELGTDHLKLLWDPCNSLYCNEPAYPDGYEELCGGYIGHIHLKDSLLDIPKATVQCTALGEGHMAPHLEPLAKALKADGYEGAISLESVYRPDGGTFEDGFRASIETMERLYS